MKFNYAQVWTLPKAPTPTCLTWQKASSHPYFLKATIKNLNLSSLHFSGLSFGRHQDVLTRNLSTLRDRGLCLTIEAQFRQSIRPSSFLKRGTLLVRLEARGFIFTAKNLISDL